MLTTRNKETKNPGTVGVKNLRINDLRKGIPFMINSNDLPPRQFYLEYPDGAIKLTTIAKGSRDFITISILSESESLKLRQKFDLSDFA